MRGEYLKTEIKCDSFFSFSFFDLKCDSFCFLSILFGFGFGFGFGGVCKCEYI